jgi:hypothetical protein
MVRYSRLCCSHMGIHADRVIVLLSDMSETALDAIKLGDFGLGVIQQQDVTYSSYAGTQQYKPPVSFAFPLAWRIIQLLNIYSIGNQEFCPNSLDQ